jgi:hypothetical protein
MRLLAALRLDRVQGRTLEPQRYAALAEVERVHAQLGEVELGRL